MTISSKIYSFIHRLFIRAKIYINVFLRSPVMKALEIGDQLRALRKIKKLTTQQLADSIHISQSYISRFENNYATPNIDMLHRILNALGTDLSTFFAYEFQDMPADFLQLMATVKTLSPEERIKLNEFLEIIKK